MPPAQVDLTPFGFTGTESAVYGALLRSGPATGYAVAQAVGLARANVYAALSGLVARQAAALLAGRPARYRPVDPQTLVTQLAAQL
ncbi:MAG TPA: helix-turn-helix domain-containing protein, partial [Gemmatimonadales bacterium]|nr:helix-turn-helix domain-containing protein [Gemmatimonadales bacterium]